MQSSAVAASTSRKIDYGWVIVAAGFITVGFVFAIQYSFGVFFKPLQDTFGWSRAATSLAMTLHLVVFALTVFATGWMLDHVNPRVVFSVSALLVGTGLALNRLVTEVWQLYLVWSLPMAIGMGICGPPVMSIVTRWLSKRRGLALGIASGGSGFGTLMGAPIANWLIGAYGWRNAFTILGVVAGVFILICAQFMKLPPRPGKPPQPKDGGTHVGPAPAQPEGMTFRQAMLSQEMRLILVSQIFSVFALRMIMVHIAPHATDIGITPSMAALAVGAIGGFSLIGRVGMGFVQDKIGPQRSMVICTALQAVALLALPFIRSDLLFFVFAMAFGLTYGGDMPQIPALTAECFGLATIGLTFGLVICISILGGAAGPIMAGYAFDVTGSYTIIFLSSGVGVGIAAWLIRMLKPRYRPSTSREPTH